MYIFKDKKETVYIFSTYLDFATWYYSISYRALHVLFDDAHIKKMQKAINSKAGKRLLTKEELKEYAGKELV
jgi:hypothetical protein